MLEQELANVSDPLLGRVVGLLVDKSCPQIRAVTVEHCAKLDLQEARSAKRSGNETALRRSPHPFAPDLLLTTCRAGHGKCQSITGRVALFVKEALEVGPQKPSRAQMQLVRTEHEGVDVRGHVLQQAHLRQVRLHVRHAVASVRLCGNEASSCGCEGLRSN